MTKGVYRDINQYFPTTQDTLTDGEVISQSIHIILSTRKGERLFDPEFGIDLEDELFDIIDEVSAFEIERLVIEAVTAFEPRLSLDLSATKVVAYPSENKFELIISGSIVGLNVQSFEQSFNLVK